MKINDSEKSLIVTDDSPKEVKGPIHFVAGGIGGMVGAVLTSPLDVIKTRLQSTYYQQLSKAHIDQFKATAPKPKIIGNDVRLNVMRKYFLYPIRNTCFHFKDTLSLIADIYHHEGFRAMFRGLGPNLVGVIPARSINFFVYGNTKRILADMYLGGKESSVVHLSSAVVAGVVTSIATNPIWVIKTRLQLDKQRHSHENGVSDHTPRKYRNSWDCIMKTYKAEKFAGFYRGITASFLGLTDSVTHWVLYEWFKKLNRSYHAGQDENSVSNWIGKLGSAGLAKFIASGVTYPHEVLRTRLRQDGGHLKYRGLINCFTVLLKEEGLAALYGGITAHMMRVVPNAMIMFGCYELILFQFR